ncbi:helix-turn-helix domain-containing protein [Erysipelothrix sp. strain 2 (EsS2-6-Brazil)]|uniref:helix-turn-helix domain-containing protein n=1 Tax=Erysipelothrix sp. strain 2 (EsS2-6-Brazil) TaxID=2500549 RepID=UPI0013770BCE|nr:helix-turn-helix transcriptional regulator [Erysipelothrix sp. strain 2 (EsS2-6-Brazil)]MBK2401650.1 XRE family transcriptional regulator [Erysipelothrix sp. strain 2 (EsS2-6-Brazil)]MDE8338229.1 helix-turn-helix transcriptional regulator [Erysipelothrix rhusiopathiae]NBA00811.1 helix-turn-helix domain-containing protein [Erysipelothrix rhusiopathiae]
MNQDEKDRLGLILKKYRIKNNMTLEYVADKLNITHKSVQFWEQGKNEIKLSKLIAISKLYNISIDSILEEANIK